MLIVTMLIPIVNICSLQEPRDSHGSDDAQGSINSQRSGFDSDSEMDTLDSKSSCSTSSDLEDHDLERRVNQVIIPIDSRNTSRSSKSDVNGRDAKLDDDDDDDDDNNNNDNDNDPQHVTKEEKEEKTEPEPEPKPEPEPELEPEHDDLVEQQNISGTTSSDSDHRDSVDAKVGDRPPQPPIEQIVDPEDTGSNDSAAREPQPDNGHPTDNSSNNEITTNHSISASRNDSKDDENVVDTSTEEPRATEIEEEVALVEATEQSNTVSDVPQPSVESHVTAEIDDDVPNNAKLASSSIDDDTKDWMEDWLQFNKQAGALGKQEGGHTY